MNNEQNDSAYSIVYSTPTMVSVTITSRCNLRCVMCHHSQSKIKKQDVTDEVIEKLSSHMRLASAIDLTGLGEPWLSPQFSRILEMFPIDDNSKDSEFKISYNCNGTRFNQNDIDLIMSSGVRRIRISIDSSDPVIFRSIRGVELEEILVETSRLIAAKQSLGRRYPLIGVQMTLMKSNFDNAMEMVDLCKRLGIDFLDVWSLNELEREVAIKWNVGSFNYESQKIGNIPQSQIDQLIENIHTLSADRRLHLLTMVRGNSRWSEGYPGDEWGEQPAIRWKPESIRCALPWQVQRSHYDGEVHACCWTTSPIADLRECTAEEAWNGPVIQAMRKNLINGRIPEQCSGAGCPFVLGRTFGEERVEEVRMLGDLELNLFNELLTQEIMRAHVTSGTSVIDAGANAGAHTKLLSQLVGVDGVVHTFEPNPIFLSKLSTIAENVRVWVMALGSELCIRDLFVPIDDDEQASLEYERASRSGHEIVTFSIIEGKLDDLPEIARTRISLIKIDVEGHEMQALHGMRATIHRDQPVVVYESNTEEINQFWSELGYTVYFPSVDQRIATPNVVALPASFSQSYLEALIGNETVDRLLKEVKHRLNSGGTRLCDRLLIESE